MTPWAAPVPPSSLSPRTAGELTDRGKGIVAQSNDEGEELVGVGENLFCAGDVRGEARWFRSPADVVSAVGDDLAGVIAFVYQGGMTFLSPILADVTGVVCTTGSCESHLALLAREFEKPCVMAAHLDVVVSDGDTIVLHLEDPVRARITRDARLKALF